MYLVRLGAKRALVATIFWALVLTSCAMLLGQRAKADPAAFPSTDLPSHVTAVYRVSFGLLGDIGHFKFTSDLEGNAYTLGAKAKIDTAVFDYSGKMSSTGSVYAASAAPDHHEFRYRQKALFGKKKVKSLSITFNGSGATVDFVPPEDRSKKKDIVQVQDEDLKGVLDPLSGVLALSLGDINEPCLRELPIFDGKQRFDLIFSPTGRVVGARSPVCRVRLIPISGHKKGEGADSIITGDIEVVMRPVPKANIVVPYRVTVPTIIGSAVLASEKVDITMPDRQRIALRR